MAVRLCLTDESLLFFEAAPLKYLRRSLDDSSKRRVPVFSPDEVN